MMFVWTQRILTCIVQLTAEGAEKKKLSWVNDPSSPNHELLYRQPFLQALARVFAVSWQGFDLGSYVSRKTKCKEP